ncbi:hypothetical protein N7512_000794 [Penicillium capsulatum]|nr:hypothetical protein N7512_000794 [Penicillium capsulatum]
MTPGLINGQLQRQRGDKKKKSNTVEQIEKTLGILGSTPGVRPLLQDHRVDGSHALDSQLHKRPGQSSMWVKEGGSRSTTPMWPVPLFKDDPVSAAALPTLGNKSVQISFPGSSVGEEWLMAPPGAKPDIVELETG